MRQDMVFARPFRMEKLVNFIYGSEHQCNFDKNLKLSQDIEVAPGKKSYTIKYVLNKKVLTFD